MSYKRLIVFSLLIIFAFSSLVIAQESTQEATELPETTQEPELTPEATDAPEVTQEPETTETPSENGTYIVQVGDTLYSIAVRFGLTINDLVEANGISNSSLIYVGQVLIIPGLESSPATETPEPEPPPTEAPPVESGAVYIVQLGDTLFRIAIRNDTTLNTLLRLNPQISDSSTIFVGQRINLPASAEITPEVEATEEAKLNFPIAQGIEVFLSDEVDIDALLSQLAQLNVLWVKVTVDWEEVESQQGIFAFEQLDEAVEAFDSAGYNLILTLTGAPEWSRPSATELALQQPTYGPPDDLAYFGAFVGAIAEHYVGIVDAYEIWHQPNNRLSWMIPDVEMRSDGFPDARLSSVRYIGLLEVAAIAIDAADPDALIITAGLAPTDINDYYNSIDNFVFFEELLKQGALNYADVIGIHIDGYNNAPDAECCAEIVENGEAQFDISEHFFFSATLDNYRTILDRNGGSDIPMWITRFSWGTAENALSQPSPEFSFVSLNTALDQSNYALAAFQLANQRGDIGPMIYYNLNGCAVGDTVACYYSTIDANNSARPVFTAIADLELDSPPSSD